MGAEVKDTRKGRVKCAGVREFIQGCGSGGSPLWAQDVGADTPYGPDSGGVLAQAGLSYDRETTAATD